jgi:hypothetical protein
MAVSVAYRQVPEEFSLLDEFEDIDDFDDEFVLTPELLALIEESRQQARDGNVVRCNTREEYINHLNSLWFTH